MPMQKFRTEYPLLFCIHRYILHHSVVCLTILFLTVVTVIIYSSYLSNLAPECSSQFDLHEQEHEIYSNKVLNKSIVFVTGIPHSGEALVNKILDSYASILCKEVATVITKMLAIRLAWEKSTIEWNRLKNGGITELIMDSAIRAFVYEILNNDSKDSVVLCNKNPYALQYATYLSSIFPNAKFLLLIRDARAVIDSIVAENNSLNSFSSNAYRRNLRAWDDTMRPMLNECVILGTHKCLLVYYERLVLQPSKSISSILKFLNLSRKEVPSVLEELTASNMTVSQFRSSSNQNDESIDIETLTKWTEKFPKDIRSEIDSIAPLLKQLGYDTKSDIPIYGIPESFIKKNERKFLYSG